MDYVSCSEGRSRGGLRLVLSAGSPNPWGEAAKAIFHVKNVTYVAVRHQGMADNDELFAWTGTRNAPVAMYEDEKPRHTWVDILYLAERLGGGAPLLPTSRLAQVECIGLAHAICGEDGLGWNRRLDLFHLQVQRAGGDPAKTILPARMFKDFNATRLAMAEASSRLIDVLAMFDDRVASQARRGSRYLIGSELTAADLYLATFMGMVSPLPENLCPMPAYIRDLYCSGTSELRDAVTPRLEIYRDKIYRRHLRLPMDF